MIFFAAGFCSLVPAENTAASEPDREESKSDKIKIGVFYIDSKTGHNYWMAAKKAYEQHDLNDRIELLAYPYLNENDGAKILEEHAIENRDELHFIFGPTNSGPILSLHDRQPVEKWKVPIISSLVTSGPDVTNESLFFTTAVSDRRKASVLAGFVINKRIRTCAILYEDTLFGKNAELQFRELLPSSRLRHYRPYKISSDIEDFERDRIDDLLAFKPEAIGIFAMAEKVRELSEALEKRAYTMFTYEPYIFTSVDMRSALEGREEVYFLTQLSSDKVEPPAMQIESAEEGSPLSLQISSTGNDKALKIGIDEDLSYEASSMRIKGAEGIEKLSLQIVGDTYSLHAEEVDQDGVVSVNAVRGGEKEYSPAVMENAGDVETLSYHTMIFALDAIKDLLKDGKNITKTNIRESFLRYIQRKESISEEASAYFLFRDLKNVMQPQIVLGKPNGKIEPVATFNPETAGFWAGTIYSIVNRCDLTLRRYGFLVVINLIVVATLTFLISIRELNKAIKWRYLKVLSQPIAWWYSLIQVALVCGLWLLLGETEAIAYDNLLVAFIVGTAPSAFLNSALFESSVGKAIGLQAFHKSITELLMRKIEDEKYRRQNTKIDIIAFYNTQTTLEKTLDKYINRSDSNISEDLSKSAKTAKEELKKLETTLQRKRHAANWLVKSCKWSRLLYDHQLVREEFIRMGENNLIDPGIVFSNASDYINEETQRTERFVNFFEETRKDVESRLEGAELNHARAEGDKALGVRDRVRYIVTFQRTTPSILVDKGFLMKGWRHHVLRPKTLWRRIWPNNIRKKDARKGKKGLADRADASLSFTDDKKSRFVSKMNDTIKAKQQSLAKPLKTNPAIQNKEQKGWQKKRSKDEAQAGSEKVQR